MKSAIFTAVVFLLAVCIMAQDSPKSPATYHHCTYVGGSANTPHLFDMSEIYQCDEGEVELAGRMEMAIEYGYVYQSEMGKPSCERPHPVSEADYDNYEWCPKPCPQ